MVYVTIYNHIACYSTCQEKLCHVAYDDETCYNDECRKQDNIDYKEIIMSKSTSLIIQTTSAILGAVFIALYFIPSTPTIAFGIVGVILIFVVGLYAMITEAQDNSCVDHLAYSPINNPFHRW